MPRTRVADLYLNCDGSADYLVTPDGLQVELAFDDQRELVSRQDGRTVRGADTIGSSVILRPMSAGQPEVVSDQREALQQIYRLNRPDPSIFGCQQQQQQRPLLNLFLLLIAIFAFSTSIRFRTKDD